MITSAARSVSVVAAVVAVAGFTAGCASTQTQASWKQLDSARIRAAAHSTRVKVASPAVRPVHVALVRDKKRQAFVVVVRNSSRRSVSDLPISVGYASAGKRVYENASSSLAYFGSHLPVIRAHRTLTWVYTTSRKVPHGARLFAIVGARSAPRQTITAQDDIPLTVQNNGTAHGSLKLKLTNHSGVLQYQLQVYAYAGKAGKYSAAGHATIAEAHPGSTMYLRVPIVGDASARHLHATAVPTILQ